jgi:hypothetical protein
LEYGKIEKEIGGDQRMRGEDKDSLRFPFLKGLAGLFQ